MGKIQKNQPSSAPLPKTPLIGSSQGPLGKIKDMAKTHLPIVRDFFSSEKKATPLSKKEVIQLTAETSTQKKPPTLEELRQKETKLTLEVADAQRSYDEAFKRWEDHGGFKSLSGSDAAIDAHIARSNRKDARFETLTAKKAELEATRDQIKSLNTTPLSSSSEGTSAFNSTSRLQKITAETSTQKKPTTLEELRQKEAKLTIEVADAQRSYNEAYKQWKEYGEFDSLRGNNDAIYSNIASSDITYACYRTFIEKTAELEATRDQIKSLNTTPLTSSSQGTSAFNSPSLLEKITKKARTCLITLFS